MLDVSDPSKYNVTERPVKASSFLSGKKLRSIDWKNESGLQMPYRSDSVF